MVTQLSRTARRGMSLVEMLAAMAVTLILILALAQVFSIIGDNVADGRALVRGTSAWLVMHAERRRPVRLPEAVYNFGPDAPERALILK